MRDGHPAGSAAALYRAELAVSAPVRRALLS